MRPASKWPQIAGVIAQQIEDGIWPIGQTLPGHRDLAITHGVAQRTIRKAINRLAETGLVEIEPGIGVRVIRTSPGPETTRPPSTVEERLADLEAKASRLTDLEARVSHLEAALAACRDRCP